MGFLVIMMCWAVMIVLGLEEKWFTVGVLYITLPILLMFVHLGTLIVVAYLPCIE